MKVSVIVPVYNVYDYIDKCLNSLVNQTLNDIEIIVVNDGSTDKSQEIVDRYAKEYGDKIKSFSQKNRGQAAARNYGLEKSSGKYITYVDSDDYIDLNMIENLYVEAEKEKLDIVICDIMKEYGNKSCVFKNFWSVKDENNKNFMTAHMGPVARLYRRDFLIKNNFKFMEGVIYEDLASIPILGMYVKKIGYIDNVYYHYVIRDGSSMKQLTYNKKMEGIFEIMESLSTKITDEYFDELEYLYIEHFLYGASLRFIQFNKREKLIKIRKIMEDKYPKYYKNIYYKNKSLKFRVVCFLIYHKLYGVVSILKRISGN